MPFAAFPPIQFGEQFMMMSNRLGRALGGDVPAVCALSENSKRIVRWRFVACLRRPTRSACAGLL